ncbi:MAG: TonB-dependent receptor [Bacteroidota bacterium]
MKKLFFWGLILFALQVHSQNYTVSGKITDNETPLAGVSVQAKATNQGSFSDENGNYELSLPEGNYTLIFSFGNRKKVKINLTEDVELNVDMSDAFESLEEVLVQSVRVKADSPITHSNISKEEIRERNLGQDIPILLNFMPSVVSTSDAGNGVGYTGIRVRGSDASRVNVTLNGIPYNDQESQGTFWVNLPDFASSTENMQLQRGVGTSTNGSGAFGASLNILTDGISEEAYGEVSNSYGSFNTRKHNVKFSTGLLNDHIEVQGRLSNIQSDGYIDRAFSDLKSYFLQGSYKDNNTLVKAIVFGGHNITYQAWNGVDRQTLEEDRTFNPSGQYTDSEGNTRFYDNEIDNYKQDHYQLHWNQKINKNWSTNLSLNYTYGRGYFEQFREDDDMQFHGIEPVQVDGETIESTDIIRKRWLDNDYYVLNASANYKDNNWDITGGAFYSHYSNDHFGEVIWARVAGNSEKGDLYYDGNGTKRETTVFTKATYRFNDKFSAFGDLQGRFINYQTSGVTSALESLSINEDYNFFNPKAGLTYQINDKHQLYTSYGRANREPRRTDFVDQGIRDAEQLDDYELGWRFVSEKVSVSTNVYYMDYKDQMVMSGQLDDVGRPIRETVGESYRMGIEVDADIKISPMLSTRPNFTLSRNQNQDYVTQLDGELVELGSTEISFSPGVIAGNMLMFHPNEKFQIGLLSKYVGEQYMSNTEAKTSKLESFFTNDLNIVYEMKNVGFFKSIMLNALVNNIFDVKYESNGYYYTFDQTNDDGGITTFDGAGFYPQAGINFLVGATLRF